MQHNLGELSVSLWFNSILQFIRAAAVELRHGFHG